MATNMYGHWKCANCGTLVIFGEVHNCITYSSPQHLPNYCSCGQMIPILERIKNLLKELIKQTSGGCK